MIVKSKRMFVMDRGSVEKSRQRRSLPLRSPLKPALARKRAGRSPILSAHALSEIRVKTVFVSYIMQRITNFRCKASQRTISRKVRSVLKNYLSPTGKDGHMNFKFYRSGVRPFIHTYSQTPSHLSACSEPFTFLCGVMWHLSFRCRVSARQPSHFCFGKSGQNH